MINLLELGITADCRLLTGDWRLATATVGFFAGNGRYAGHVIALRQANGLDAAFVVHDHGDDVESARRLPQFRPA